MPIVNDYTAIVSQNVWGGDSALANRPQFVTFSFENVVQPYLTNSDYTQAFLNSFTPFTEAEKNVARNAMTQWANASGLIFLEVTAGQGDIRFGAHNFSLDPNARDYSGFAYYPNTNIDNYYSYREQLGGDVFINIGDADSTYLLLHEIGHAIGLKHPFEGDVTLSTSFDNHSNTVMSYTGTYPSVLGIFDRQAIAYLYGAPGSGGSQLTSWSWNAATLELFRNGTSAAEVIYGVAVRDIINGGNGNDTIAGFQGNDALYGSNGNDVLFGNEGADVLDGGVGSDILTGDSGSDSYYVDAESDIVSEFDVSIISGGNDIVYFGASSGSYSLNNNIERLTLIGNSAINGVGNSLNNTMFGNGSINSLRGFSGNDLIHGLAGNDMLYGEDGSDSIYGGWGADRHDGGEDSNFDYARYDDVNYGNLVISLSNSSINTGAARGDTYFDIEGLFGGLGNDYVIGAATANSLFGGGGGDLIYGLAGADYLNGGAEGDNLYGGLGADTHFGGDGQGLDFARYDDGIYGNLTIRLDFTSLNTGAAAGDRYYGIEGIVGGLGKDLIIGNAAGNYLFGSGGFDYIDGQNGNDFLSGGAGNDRFGFTTALNAATNVDFLLDFAHGADDLLLKQSIFASIGIMLDSGELRLGRVAVDGNDYVIYNNNTGQLFYDADGAGAGLQTLFARVTIGTVLDTGDFLMA